MASRKAGRGRKKSGSRGARGTRARRRATPAPDDAGWSLSDAEVERALASPSPEHARQLEELLGEGQYEELRSLARQAREARRRRGPGPRVLILPGLMGSKLGRRRPVFDDVYWLDPLALSAGVAQRLALDAGDARVAPLGVFQFVYLKLKLLLTIDGFDADFHPFDWRRSLKTLGNELAAHLARHEAGRPVSIVAHSMGGLVARSAQRAGARLRRLVMLGTPSYGSFSTVQALRGVHEMVTRLAALDLGASAEQLVDRVFSSFPSLYEMLPSPQRYSDLDFFDPDTWPASPVKIRRALLRAARPVQDWLAPAGPDTFLIAGVNRSTVTSARREGEQFCFDSTLAGDGTVPWSLARLEGARTWFVDEQHGSLPNNRSVIRAVAQLLDDGATDLLPESPPPARTASALAVCEQDLRRARPLGTRSARQLRPVELRNLLREFAAPAEPVAPLAGRAELPADTAAAVEAPWRRLTVGRLNQHRLEIQLAHASITDVEARAYVLGLFREVSPAGAARAVDEYLDGAIAEFMRRRMFSGGVGETFVLPSDRRPLRTEGVLFAGLGFFDQFNEQVLEVAAENTLRTFVRTHVEDFATVLLGAGSGLPVPVLVEHMMRGFVRGKLDADGGRRFRCLTLCETDPERYQEIRREIYRLVGTPLFDEIEVSLSELAPRRAPDLRYAPASAPESAPAGPDPIYLLVRQLERGEGSGPVDIQASLLTASAKAVVVTDVVRASHHELDRALADLARQVDDGALTAAALASFGQRLRELTIPDSIAGLMGGMRDRHLVVVHDAPASRIPWETLRIGDWAPALGRGISRRYMASNLSVAKYLQSRPPDGRLDVLVVVDPTQDLAGAEQEGQALLELLAGQAGLHVKTLSGDEATRRALLRELESGVYDVVHYAGHAFFDAEQRARSGLICAGDEVLSGADLATLGNLPSLIVFNACESGRLRGRRSGPRRKGRKAPDYEGSVGAAEALLRGGVANFIGTYWPVRDDAALAFARSLYASLQAARPLGDAIVAARKEVQQRTRSSDWADYLHYGDPAFVVRAGGAAP